MELDAVVPNTAPTFTITETTSTSITYNSTFSTSVAKGNAVYIIDFNQANGLTTERNASGETAMFSFTPDRTDTYVFKAENYNGGSTEYDMYI